MLKQNLSLYQMTTAELYEFKQTLKSETESGVDRKDVAKTVDFEEPCDDDSFRLKKVLSTYEQVIQSGYRTKGNHSSDLCWDGKVNLLEKPIKRIDFEDYDSFNKQKLTYKSGYQEPLPDRPSADEVRIAKGIWDVPKLLLPMKQIGASMNSSNGANGYNGWEREKVQREDRKDNYQL